MNESFMYQIVPRRPIRSLIPGKNINRPCSLKLTKEQVILCMKYGPVYRCMPGSNPIRVTGKNLDSLHVSTAKKMIKEPEEIVLFDGPAQSNNVEDNTDNVQLDFNDVVHNTDNDVVAEQMIYDDQLDIDLPVETYNNSSDIVNISETESKDNTEDTENEIVLFDGPSENKNITIKEDQENFNSNKSESVESDNGESQQNYQYSSQNKNNYNKKKNRHR